MKRVILFVPFVIALIFIAFVIKELGVSSLSILPTVAVSICFLVSGLLLSCGKAWGSIFSIIVSCIIVYNGSNNWKLAELEMSIGIILLTFYLVCSIVVYSVKKK